MTTLTRRRGKHRAPRPPRRPASTVSGLVAAAGLALTLAACGGSGSDVPDEDAVAAAVEDAVGTSDEDVEAAVEEWAESVSGKPDAPDEPLAVGDCAETIWYETPAAGLPSIDCDEEHDAEVYLAVPLDELGPSFPGTSEMQDHTKRDCTTGFEDFVGIPVDQSVNMFSVVYPTEESWADGDRTALCYATGRTMEPLTGSLEGVAE
ncbi:septum formation family protein [Modestobacter versicolor]|uniref:Putative small lipoprotein YifL n=1 Tax=Modestobacter versicolor TaxID=429133 RepID=A0A839Y3Y8_9ACTN|nr:septum formation family protein [Modestobacter versicolor]MBB3677449.1 putative small lipoprotein YifL [Modestobacter versicolor]